MYEMGSLYADRQSLTNYVKRLSTTPLYAGQELKRVDGRHIYAVAAATGVFDQHQQLVQVAGFFLEESAIRASSQGLDDSRRMETLTRLAGHIAVNLNELLWIAGDRLPAPEAEHLLAQTQETIGTTSHFLRQLLAFGRLQKLRPVTINLNSLLSRLKPMLTRILPPSIEAELELAEDLGTTTMDETQLEHLILELVTNARGATPGLGRVVLKTENMTIDSSNEGLDGGVPPGSYIVLGVSDNGIGMDVVDLERAFDPSFSTLWSANGLGLSAVYGIVKQSNGFVRIVSTPGQGTTVLVFLPRTLQEIPAQHTVLIVEPDESRRNHMAGYLKDCGYLVLAAASGLGACKVAVSHEGKIDVLVTEFVMKDMSGPELAERLLMTRPGLLVVFVATALEFELDGSRAVETFSAKIVRKPIRSKDLVAAVQALLNPIRLIG